MLLLGVAALSAVAAALVLVRVRAARLAWMLFAPVVLLQSQASALKVLYLVSALVVLAMSRRAIAAEYRASRPYRIALQASASFVGVLLISSSFQEAGLDTWIGVRESVSYLFLCLIPMLGVTFRNVSTRLISIFIPTLGMVAACSYLLATIEARGAGSGGLSGIRSLTLIAVPVAWGFSTFLASGGRAVWALVLSELSLALAIASGTRTALSLLAIPLALLPFVLTRWRLAAKFTVATASTIVATWLAMAQFLPRLISNPYYYEQRYRVLLAALKGGGQMTSDTSYNVRNVHYQWAIQQIDLHPLFGTGPGYAYSGLLNGTSSIYMLDTPWITVAKVGVIGAVLLVTILMSLLTYQTRVAKAPRGGLYSRVALAAFAAALLPSGSIFEDKGLGVGLLVLTISVGRSAVEPVSDDKLGGRVFA
jgi:hypothetical protein